MTKTSKILLGIVVAPFILYGLFQLSINIYIHYFGLIETDLNKRTIAEWNKATAEEQFSACIIMITAVIKNDDVIDPLYKQKVSGLNALKAEAKICVTDMERYIKKAKINDKSSVAMTYSSISGLKGHFNVKFPVGFENPLNEE